MAHRQVLSEKAKALYRTANEEGKGRVIVPPTLTEHSTKVQVLTVGQVLQRGAPVLYKGREGKLHVGSDGLMSVAFKDGGGITIGHAARLMALPAEEIGLDFAPSYGYFGAEETATNPATGTSPNTESGYYQAPEQQNEVSIDGDGTITVRGERLVNRYSDPLAAIDRDSEGNVVGVDLETEGGHKRLFTGAMAEDVAYQITLKQLEQNGHIPAFEQHVSNDPAAGSAIEEEIHNGGNKPASQEGATKTDARVSGKQTTKRNGRTRGKTSSAFRNVISGKETKQQPAAPGTALPEFIVPQPASETEQPVVVSLENTTQNQQRHEQHQDPDSGRKGDSNRLRQTTDGTHLQQRFSPAEQRGCAAGGSIHVEASLIAGREVEADEDQDERADRQEDEVEAWAKEQGIWHEDAEGHLAGTHGDMLDSGGESKVYDNGDTVVKTSNINQYRDLQGALDGITLHNAWFPESAIRIIGFGRGSDGNFNILTEQPFIKGTHNISQEEIDAFVSALGFEKDDSLDTEGRYKSKDALLRDLKPKNVVLTAEGRIVPIDTIFHLNTPVWNVGGTRGEIYNAAENTQDGTNNSPTTAPATTDSGATTDVGSDNDGVRVAPQPDAGPAEDGTDAGTGLGTDAPQRSGDRQGDEHRGNDSTSSEPVVEGAKTEQELSAQVEENSPEAIGEVVRKIDEDLEEEKRRLEEEKQRSLESIDLLEEQTKAELEELKKLAQEIEEGSKSNDDTSGTKAIEDAVDATVSDDDVDAIDKELSEQQPSNEPDAQDTNGQPQPTDKQSRVREAVIAAVRGVLKGADYVRQLTGRLREVVRKVIRALAFSAVITAGGYGAYVGSTNAQTVGPDGVPIDNPTLVERVSGIVDGISQRLLPSLQEEDADNIQTQKVTVGEDSTKPGIPFGFRPLVVGLTALR